MSGRKPRICVLTARGFSHEALMAGVYEAEDILVEVDDAELIYLKPRRGYEFRQRTHARLVWHDFTKSLAFANMAFEPVNLTKEYDLLVIYIPYQIDHLLHVAAVRSWKNYCRTSVCWIDEMFATHIPRLRYWLPALTQFDHVVVGYSGSVRALTRAISRRVPIRRNGEG